MLAAWEIHASDPEALARFYGDALGWSFRQAEMFGNPYLIVETANGAPVGRIIRRHGDGPQPGATVSGAVISFAVDDLDATFAAMVEAGATAAMPRFDLPGGGAAAYLLDPDNNVFGLVEAP